MSWSGIHMVTGGRVIASPAWPNPAVEVDGWNVPATSAALAIR